MADPSRVKKSDVKNFRSQDPERADTCNLSTPASEVLRLLFSKFRDLAVERWQRLTSGRSSDAPANTNASSLLTPPSQTASMPSQTSFIAAVISMPARLSAIG